MHLHIYGGYASSLAYIVVAGEPRALKVSTEFVQNIMELGGGSQPAFSSAPPRHGSMTTLVRVVNAGRVLASSILSRMHQT